MFEILLVVTICILSANQAAAGAALETIDGQGLLNLAKTEKHVVALFTTPDCQTCEEYENVVTNIREDLVDSLSAWVVKVVNSDLLRTYTPNKEPALVYFRNGIPLLYEGPLNDEEILSMFIENKEVVIKGLTDDSFEHLTQASTGATTGDWLILFYSSDHIASLQLIARWETVGAKLKGRINVARIDKYVSGAATARRFNVYDVPEILFLRLGKVYRYTGPYDIESLVSFAKEGYKQIHGEKVPEPQSAFDDMIHIIVNWLREHPLVMKFGSMLSCILVIILGVSKLKQKSSTSHRGSPTNDTNDDDEDEGGEEEDSDAHQKSSGLSQKKEN